ncbi:hypothetical protein JDV02_010119 [Purpureocillium takamizusanense]|uniref:Fido domain-containing protein n=1 Tax=Purpureocillium takamizusanense TaxID=2060973 RepID=A0A9Q8QTV1_9HYPO|nr:uncharacterized protein JDV02_010119 [Purpureocillium takamizusanense]UNI24367.1 hypothetical protein JDV02_010119 [Purpureocillium takamizusanense]
MSNMDPSELRFFVYGKLAADASRPPAVLADQAIRNRDNMFDEASEGAIYTELVNNLATIQKRLQALNVNDRISALEPAVSEMLARMIYGSNRVAKVGGGWEATLDLCRPIFRSKKSALDVYREELEYEALADPRRQPISTIVTPPEIRKDHEIIQHAKAAKYMLTELHLHGHGLSEEILLNTHRILTHNIDSADGVPPTKYGGIYCKSSSASPDASQQHEPTSISRSVQDMIQSLNRDLATVEKGQLLSPIAFAAKYCQIFCEIRPFYEGNGRMGRLLLNAMLLKTVGAVACVGSDAQSQSFPRSIIKSTCDSPNPGQVDPRNGNAISLVHGLEALSSTILKSLVDTTGRLAKSLRTQTSSGYKPFSNCLAGK